jgi:hypothetical protein
VSKRPTTRGRVRERWEAIREAPHRQLDGEFDRALKLDDERDVALRDEPEQLASEEEAAG